MSEEKIFTDADRLMFATKDFDGFVGVVKDKYDYAIDVAEENGRDEPTVEDELEGVRRLIDTAMIVNSINDDKFKKGLPHE